MRTLQLAVAAVAAVLAGSLAAVLVPGPKPLSRERVPFVSRPALTMTYTDLEGRVWRAERASESAPWIVTPPLGADQSFGGPLR